MEQEAARKGLGPKAMDQIQRWWPYLAMAAVAAATWLVFGLVGLAIATCSLVFLAVAFFVGGLSESFKRGIGAGVIAVLPLVFFFLWLLK